VTQFKEQLPLSAHSKLLGHVPPVHLSHVTYKHTGCD